MCTTILKVKAKNDCVLWQCNRSECFVLSSRSWVRPLIRTDGALIVNPLGFTKATFCSTQRRCVGGNSAMVLSNTRCSGLGRDKLSSQGQRGGARHWGFGELARLARDPQDLASSP